MFLSSRSAVLVVVSLGLAMSVEDLESQDFDAEYQALLGSFAGALSEESSVESLMEQAAELRDRIRQHRRDHRDDLTDGERDALADLADEVRALRSVSRVVGQVHNAAEVSIESFEAVKGRLDLAPQVLLTHESGVQLVELRVGGFVSLLLHNPTATTFSVTYGVNDPERPGGVGSAACESYSVMSGLFNSRDRDLDGLEFTLDTRPNRAGGCD